MTEQEMPMDDTDFYPPEPTVARFDLFKNIFDSGKITMGEMSGGRFVHYEDYAIKEARVKELEAIETALDDWSKCHCSPQTTTITANEYCKHYIVLQDARRAAAVRREER